MLRQLRRLQPASCRHEVAADPSAGIRTRHRWRGQSPPALPSPRTLPESRLPPYSSPSVIPRNVPPANHPVGAFNRSHQLGLRRISCWLDKNPSFSISIRRAASRRLTTTSTGVSPAWFPSTKTPAPGGDDSTVMRCVVPLVINVAHPVDAVRSKHATSHHPLSCNAIVRPRRAQLRVARV